MSGPICLVALSESRPHAERIAALLNVSLLPVEERDFEDGEQKIRPLASVRGGDVYVFQCLHGDASAGVHDRLCRLLFSIATLRDASAGRLTAVLPYLCYARKDRRTKTRDPLNLRYVATLLEAVGVDRVVTLDVHNPAAYQNAFRCVTEHVGAQALFAERLIPMIGHGEISVVSPDVGGIKRAEQLRLTLSGMLGRSAGMAFVEKYRSAGVVSGNALVGDVRDRMVVIVDDLVSSGGTLVRAAQTCRQAGAARVVVAVTHGLFSGDACRKLMEAAIDHVLVTDSVPLPVIDDVSDDRLMVLETAPMLAEVVRRMHGDGAVSELIALA